MIHYRSFQNTDPPALSRLCSECFSNRSAIDLDLNILLEAFIFSKPYFGPGSVQIAHDETGHPVGFALVGFGPTADSKEVDRTTGVICMLGVQTASRRKGIGSELLRRSEAYLKEQGCKEIYAGSFAPWNPFGFGLYGGSNSPGILESEAIAQKFFLRNNYQSVRSCQIMQMALEKAVIPNDSRTGDIRVNYEILGTPLHNAGFWKESVLGPIEVYNYILRDRKTKRNVASCNVWEMDFFGRKWNEQAIGILDIVVEPDYRRRGLGKFLITQLLRHLRDQFFTLAEIQIDETNKTGIQFMQKIGFQTIDRGNQFRKC